MCETAGEIGLAHGLAAVVDRQANHGGCAREDAEVGRLYMAVVDGPQGQMVFSASGGRIADALPFVVDEVGFAEVAASAVRKELRTG